MWTDSKQKVAGKLDNAEHVCAKDGIWNLVFNNNLSWFASSDDVLTVTFKILYFYYLPIFRRRGDVPVHPAHINQF